MKTISEKEKIGKPTGKGEESEERAPESLRLRISGLSFRQIGAKQGISHEQARQDVKKALRATIDSVKQEADEYREMELERLDLLWARLYPKALGGKDKTGKIIEPDLQAVTRCLHISKARRELYGLDMPVKVALTDKDGENDLVTLTINEARRRMGAIFTEPGVSENTNGTQRIPENVSE